MAGVEEVRDINPTVLNRVRHAFNLALFISPIGHYQALTGEHLGRVSRVMLSSPPASRGSLPSPLCAWLGYSDGIFLHAFVQRILSSCLLTYQISFAPGVMQSWKCCFLRAVLPSEAASFPALQLLSLPA